MAKKAKKKSEPIDLITQCERAMRKAIEAVPGLSSVSEMAYCSVVLEALDVIREGAQMRLDELEQEANESEDDN